ncbi:MAG: cell division protein ZapA [Alphaproteobacteria bacterium]
MAQVTITINSREYAIVCEDGQESRIIKLSQILDEKAKLIGGATQTSEAMLLAMVGLLIADELSEARKKIENPENQAVDFKVLEAQDEKIASELKSITTKINSIVNNL